MEESAAKKSNGLNPNTAALPETSKNEEKNREVLYYKQNLLGPSLYHPHSHIPSPNTTVKKPE